MFAFATPAGAKPSLRGTLPQLREWAREGLPGVEWGALMVRCSDQLQLLLQEVRGPGCPGFDAAGAGLIGCTLFEEVVGGLCDN
jgi:hypothetical protein